MNQSSLAHAFVSLLRRDLILGFRQSSELVNPLLFFLIVVTMFPLALGPEKTQLQEIAAAVIWVAAVLASNMIGDLLILKNRLTKVIFLKIGAQDDLLLM